MKPPPTVPDDEPGSGEMLAALTKGARRSEESLDLLATSSEGSTRAGSTSNDIEKSAEAEVDYEPKTDHRAIWTVTGISLLMFTIQNALNVSAFVYLKQLDPYASVFVQANVKAFSRLLIGSFTFFFSVHAYSRKTFRFSIIFGGVMIMVSIVVYGFLEAFPVEWRSIMWIGIFGLHAAAEGANNVFISYIPRVSSKADRTTAYSRFNGAEVLAIVIGPGIQLISNQFNSNTTLLGISWLKVTEYTLTIYICGLLALINLLVIFFLMREPPVNKNQKTIWETLKDAKQQIAKSDRKLLFFCIAEKCVASFGCTTILTLAPVLIIATFNGSKHDQNTYMTAFQLVAGLCALTTAVLFSFVKPLARIAPTRLFLMSLVGFFIAYFFCIPLLGFYSQPVVLADEAHPFGCDASYYTWCEGASVVIPYVWIIFTGAFIGIAFPLANISHDTFFSRLLGGIDQNVIQGLLQCITNISMTGIPLLSISVFTYAGPTAWWYFVEFVMVVGAILWLLMKQRLEDYVKMVDEREQRAADSSRVDERRDTEETIAFQVSMSSLNSAH